MNDDERQPWYMQKVDRADLLAVAIACAALAVTQLTPTVLSQLGVEAPLDRCSVVEPPAPPIGREGAPVIGSGCGARAASERRFGRVRSQGPTPSTTPVSAPRPRTQ